MEMTTVFKSGNSLAVRLPKGFALPIGRVIITKDEAGIHLMPTTNNWPDDLEKIFPREPKLDKWERPGQGEASESLDW